MPWTTREEFRQIALFSLVAVGCSNQAGFPQVRNKCQTLCLGIMWYLLTTACESPWNYIVPAQKTVDVPLWTFEIPELQLPGNFNWLLHEQFARNGKIFIAAVVKVDKQSIFNLWVQWCHDSNSFSFFHPPYFLEEPRTFTSSTCFWIISASANHSRMVARLNPVFFLQLQKYLEQGWMHTGNWSTLWWRAFGQSCRTCASVFQHDYTWQECF